MFKSTLKNMLHNSNYFGTRDYKEDKFGTPKPSKHNPQFTKKPSSKRVQKKIREMRAN